MSAPPAHPRDRWTPPALGTRYVRLDDLTVWRVVRAYQDHRQVALQMEGARNTTWPNERELIELFAEVDS